MCWGETASVAMTGLGLGAAVITARRGAPTAAPVALGYFTIMEGLQVAGYQVVGQCGAPANQTIALLSYLHIVFQPIVINAFAMELVPAPVRERARWPVFFLCACSAVVMLVQLAPLDWAGPCRAGAVLCGPDYCVRWGDWHIAWDIPYNGALLAVDDALNTQFAFPTYVAAVFVLPLVYGAWRFALFHALAGPILASALTRDANEFPAIWCLFSVGLLLISLSPAIRRRFETDRWWGRGRMRQG